MVTASLGHDLRAPTVRERRSGRRASRCGLYGLQIREDSPERLVAEHALPHGHALVQSPMAHRLVEHLRRLRPVSKPESAEIPRPLPLYCVGPVTVRAVLVEQASTFLHQVEAPFEGICHRRRRDLRRPRRRPRQKQERGDDSTAPGDDPVLAYRLPPGFVPGVRRTAWPLRLAATPSPFARWSRLLNCRVRTPRGHRPPERHRSPSDRSCPGRTAGP